MCSNDWRECVCTKIAWSRLTPPTATRTRTQWSARSLARPLSFDSNFALLTPYLNARLSAASLGRHQAGRWRPLAGSSYFLLLFPPARLDSKLPPPCLSIGPSDSSSFLLSLPPPRLDSNLAPVVSRLADVSSLAYLRCSVEADSSHFLLFTVPSWRNLNLAPQLYWHELVSSQLRHDAIATWLLTSASCSCAFEYLSKAQEKS